MNNYFDEAKEKAYEMTENEEQSATELTDTEEPQAMAENQESGEEKEKTVSVAENEDAEQNSITESALTAAERATEALQNQADNLSDLREENSHLKELLNEMRNARLDEIGEEVLPLPVLNIHELAFADERTVKENTEEYTKQVMDIAKQQAVNEVLKKLSPIIQKAQRQAEAQEQKEILSDLEKDARFAGISGMEGQLNDIIKNNRALQNPDLTKEEQLVTAMIIAQGVNAVNKEPKENTYDDFIAMYESSPELRQYVENKRAERLKESQQVPNLSASNGAGSAALNIPNKPKTFDEGLDFIRKKYNI